MAGKAKGRKPAAVAETSFTLVVNAHMLSGRTVGGLWQWTCPTWPKLAAYHSGKADPRPMLEEFMRRALAEPSE